MKLFNLVQPDAVVFGEKDAMQCSVIRRMLRDLDLDIRLVVRAEGGRGQRWQVPVQLAGTGTGALTCFGCQGSFTNVL